MGTMGDFPKGESPCAFLTAETLQEAHHDFMIEKTP